uniref:Uncharacterized protein n=1 Tax=Anguilla anguilla TaxID=7936 RepID=A0A0E9XEJ2_ANGAN
MYSSYMTSSKQFTTNLIFDHDVKFFP